MLTINCIKVLGMEIWVAEFNGKKIAEGLSENACRSRVADLIRRINYKKGN